MRFKFVVALCVVAAIFCARQESSRALKITQGVAASNAPSTQDPPTPTPAPAEDTARYVEWMSKRGAPFKDAPHENVSLRFADWGFYYHGDRPAGSWEPLRDRTALDRSGHAVTDAESGDWYALLSTPGLDADAALKRVAWLFNAEGVLPAPQPPRAKRDKITAPTLTNRDGRITFRGWWQAYTDPPYTRRITIVATKDATKLTLDSGDKP